jgi:LemA protein
LIVSQISEEHGIMPLLNIKFKSMSKTTKTILIILFIIGILGYYVRSKYNTLALANNNIDAQWSNVDSVLQRRFDSIDQAIGGIKASNKAEQDALQKITDARKIYVAAQGNTEAQVASANNYAGALNGLLLSRAAIGEAYPNLKTPELLGGLVAGVTVEGNENRINVERLRYNEIVKNYNGEIITFPGNVLANILGFQKRNFFELNSNETRNAPKIAPNLEF